MNLRRYLKTHGNDSAAWLNLGKLLYDRNELVQAAQAIAGGLKADPDNVRGNFLLGSIYSDLKLYEDSALYLTRAVNLEPLNIEFNRMLARSLAAAGKTQEAVKYYQRVSSLAPDDKEARQAIAAARPEMAMAFSAADTDDNQVLVVMGKTESRVVEKHREDPPVQQTGKVLYTSPDAENVSEVVTDDIETEPVQSVVVEKTPVEPVATVVPTTQETTVEQNPVPAVDVTEEKALVAEPIPVDTKVAKSSGISELEVMKKEAEPDVNELLDTVAVAAPARKVENKRNRIEEFRQKGSYEFSRGNWEAALPHYLNILKEQKDAQTYDIVGLIFEKLSMSQDAFDAVEHAYKMGMRDSATLAKLGRLAEVNGDFKKGEYYLYHALQKIPHRVDLRIRYARCLEANGREEIALRELEKIVRASGDSYAVRRRAELEMQKIRSRKQ
jgi:tetratricopeptide (TPR) repeat protein